jgi:hypothetical protein
MLYCFENMSGLKINYQKSEVIVLEASEAVSAQVAGWLNYKVGVAHDIFRDTGK